MSVPFSGSYNNHPVSYSSVMGCAVIIRVETGYFKPRTGKQVDQFKGKEVPHGETVYQTFLFTIPVRHIEYGILDFNLPGMIPFNVTESAVHFSTIGHCKLRGNIKFLEYTCIRKGLD